MRKRPKSDDTDLITCGECNGATIETKWLTKVENAPFCVWCPEDGLLKMMRWACQFGKKKKQQTIKKKL